MELTSTKYLSMMQKPRLIEGDGLNFFVQYSRIFSLRYDAYSLDVLEHISGSDESTYFKNISECLTI